MKKTFRLEGLGCASCAGKMERAINKLDGVNAASISFLTTKLTIEADDSKMDSIVEAARAIVKKTEPDVVMKRG